MWRIYLLSRCRSARRQTGRHHLVPGRWQSPGGSAHRMYGSLTPAGVLRSPSPRACAEFHKRGQDLNLYSVANTALPFSLTLSAGLLLWKQGRKANVILQSFYKTFQNC